MNCQVGTLYPGQLGYLQKLENTLNGKIKNTVTSVAKADKNVGFVELSNAFAGHQWCSNDPYVYGLSIVLTDLANNLGINPSPFHPTPAGQTRIAGLVTTEVKSLLKK